MHEDFFSNLLQCCFLSWSVYIDIFVFLIYLGAMQWIQLINPSKHGISCELSVTLTRISLCVAHIVRLTMRSQHITIASHEPLLANTRLTWSHRSHRKLKSWVRFDLTEISQTRLSVRSLCWRGRYLHRFQFCDHTRYILVHLSESKTNAFWRTSAFPPQITQWQVYQSVCIVEYDWAIKQALDQQVGIRVFCFRQIDWRIFLPLAAEFADPSSEHYRDVRNFYISPNANCIYTSRPKASLNQSKWLRHVS